MKEGKLDDIIQQFCITDTVRPQMMRPHLNSELMEVVATDAHVLIVAPIKYFDLEYQKQNSFPLYEKVIPELSAVPLFKLNTQEILARYHQIPLIDIFAECEVCEGDGEAICNLGHTHDCHSCMGTGEGNKVIGHEADENIIWQIKEETYLPKFLYRVALVAVRFGAEEIPVHHYKQKSALALIINECKILVMPRITDADTDFETIKVTRIETIQ